jgi:hypothetical protein
MINDYKKNKTDVVNETLREIKTYYQAAFRNFDASGKMPEIDVSFYPYVGINHTIRIRNGKIFARIGEICAEMPLNAQKALAFILIAKLLKKRVPKNAREVYGEYVKSTEIREKATENRRTKGRKNITSAQGKVYDLDLMFDELNEVYFENKIQKPTLTWSGTKTYRILGHYDATHQTIVISKSLDEPNVPNFVVQAVLHHEILHIKHPTKIINGRRYSHTKEFRDDEKEFVFYEESENWINKNVVNLKKAKNKKGFIRTLFDL